MSAGEGRNLLLLLPTGREGPYSLSELRELVEAGRARPDDEVQDSVSRSMTTVRALLPDAHTGDDRPRVRRRTSDRLKAQSADPRPAAAAPAKPSAPAQPRAPSPGRGKLVALAILVPLAGVLLWLGVPGLLGGGRPLAPPLDPHGTWRIDSIPGHGGPWTLTIGSDRIAIAGPGGPPSEIAMRTVGSGRWSATYVLANPHPVFGSQISLMEQTQFIWVVCAVGGLRAEHVP